MHFFTIERESGGQRSTETPQLRDCAFPRAVAGNLEGTRSRDQNLDLIAFLQLERLNHGGG
jgi:hypothetical protein